jgi:hypothetical protein
VPLQDTQRDVRLYARFGDRCGAVPREGGSVFEADINALAAAGISKGCNPPDNDRFWPTDDITRGQMAAFLHRALS